MSKTSQQNKFETEAEAEAFGKEFVKTWPFVYSPDYKIFKIDETYIVETTRYSSCD